MLLVHDIKQCFPDYKKYKAEMMKNTIQQLLVIFCLFAVTISGAQAVESYQQALDNMMSENAKKPSPFTKEEREIMKRAGMNLSKKLPNPGIAVGQLAPDFILSDAFGEKLNLKETLKKGPVILVFYRGAWCPFCNLHLHALKKNIAEFDKYNAQLIAITPQQPDKSAAQIKKTDLPFKVLSDLDSQVMKSYKLYFELDPQLIPIYKRVGIDVEAFNGKGRNVLPIPGTLVIDQQGIVRAMQAETDYTKRMEPADIIKSLKNL
jgi:peroxiredoxin